MRLEGARPARARVPAAAAPPARAAGPAATAPFPPPAGPVVSALTVDVEDYFQVSGFEDVVPRASWGRYESRVERNTERLLALLDEVAWLRRQVEALQNQTVDLLRLVETAQSANARPLAALPSVESKRRPWFRFW